MKIISIAIVAKSDTDWIAHPEMKSFSQIIGVDRGAFILLKKGILPDVAIGDFDSVTKKEMNIIRTKISDIRYYPSDKNKTDLELAVSYALALKPVEITMFGVTGGRLDQSFAAFQLLQNIHEHLCRAVIRDEHNSMEFVSGNVYIAKNTVFPYISILPASDEIMVSIKGCAYSLHKKIMKKGTTLGVSNRIVSQIAEITVHKGNAFIITSKD